MTTAPRRTSVGAIDCVALSDGGYRYPADALLAGAEPASVQAGEIFIPYTPLLFEAGGQRILLDTGLGAGFAESAGHLGASLAAAGIDPGEIDVVFLSHGHPDHIGGSVDADGRPAFPNARWLVGRGEWEFWSSGETLARCDRGALTGDGHLDGLLASFARRCLLPLESLLELVEPGDEIAPGLRLVALPGHTPAHLALEVASDGEHLLCVVDAICHELHLEQPDCRPLLDLDRETAAATRREIASSAASTSARVHGFHLPGDGFGTIVRRGESFAWQTEA